MNNETVTLEQYIEKIRCYFSSTDLAPVQITLDDTTEELTVSSEKPFNAKHMQAVGELLFFTNEVNFPNVKSFIFLSSEDNMLHINLKNYTLFVELFMKLKQFNTELTESDIDCSSLTYRYSVRKRGIWLLSKELEELQAIINSEISDHNSIRVSGSGLSHPYTLTVWL